MKKKQKKKVLALTKEQKSRDCAIYNNINVNIYHQKLNSPCRKIFVKLSPDSKWSPEMVERTRFEDRVYLESLKITDSSQSRDTSFEVTDNVKKVCKYYNTSLPLIPDIRSLSIQERCQDIFVSLFSIRTRKSEDGGSKIILRGGPNGRANRYLKYLYSVTSSTRGL